MIKVWTVLAIVALGLLQFLDTGLYSYVAYGLNVNGVYLGVLSSLWSLTYVLSNYVLGRLADYGHNRALVVLSCATTLYIGFSLNNLNEVSGLVVYSLHALAIVAVNLSVSVTILEVVDYLNWSTANSVFRLLSSAARGITLLVVALGIISIPSTTMVVAITLISLALLIPRIGINLERRLHSIDRELNNVGRYIRASAALLYSHKPRGAHGYLERVWGAGGISSGRVLLVTLLYVMSGDSVFAVLPLLFKPIISLEGVFLSWGIAFAASSLILLLLVSRPPSSVNLLAVLTVSRGIAMAAFLHMVTDTLTLAAYLLALVSLGTVADMLLYNVYVESSSGYGTSKYFIVRELGSIAGSMAGGLVLVYAPSLLPVVVLGTVAASVLALLL